MALADMFSPGGMLKAMGVDPAQMMQEYERWKGEFSAMKAAFITLHNQQRECIAKLDALAVQNAAILAALTARDGDQNNVGNDGRTENVNGGGSEREPFREAAD